MAKQDPAPTVIAIDDRAIEAMINGEGRETGLGRLDLMVNAVFDRLTASG